MGCYYTLYINVYGYSLLFYKVYHEEGECRQLEFWLEKDQTLETYSALLQKSWNSTKHVFGINKNYWAEEIHQGPTPWPGGWGHAHPYWVRPLSPGPPGEVLVLNVFLYIWKTSSVKFQGFWSCAEYVSNICSFSNQNPSCRHSPSLCKPCKIRENRHKYCDIMCNNSP